MARAMVVIGTAVLMLVNSPSPAFARDEGGMGGADLTGVDGSDQAAVPEPTNVVPDLTVESPAQLSEPPIGVWDRLAACESSSRWHLEGRTYSGGLQFDGPTWRAYGGLAYASRAAGATRGQQIAVAERLRAARGYQPWPVCSRVVGLR